MVEKTLKEKIYTTKTGTLYIQKFTENSLNQQGLGKFQWRRLKKDSESFENLEDCVYMSHNLAKKLAEDLFQGIPQKDIMDKAKRENYSELHGVLFFLDNDKKLRHSSFVEKIVENYND